ncbi:MAG: hypothetical protein M3O70_28345 [Actinomycetota bacterium]|nr:hypothetical protein [Actinomycetota bacterium]
MNIGLLTDLLLGAGTLFAVHLSRLTLRRQVDWERRQRLAALTIDADYRPGYRRKYEGDFMPHVMADCLGGPETIHITRAGLRPDSTNRKPLVELPARAAGSARGLPFAVQPGTSITLMLARQDAIEAGCSPREPYVAWVETASGDVYESHRRFGLTPAFITRKGDPPEDETE